MSVKQEAGGRRSTQVEVVVPGTPEEVWRAIATGPGVSSWFVPTGFEPEDGRPVAIRSRFGPDMTTNSPITHWDPPRAFSARGEGWGGSPPIATEWTVEAQAGGTCRVRVVNSLVADGDGWDGQLEGTEAGWPGFFRTLQLYLTHFRGQPSALVQFVMPVPGTEAEAWDQLLAAFGLGDLAMDRRWTSPAGAPTLAGTVEHMNRDPYDALVRLEPPTPGVAAFGAFGMGGQGIVAVNFYLYGDRAAEAAARDEPVWRQWLQSRLAAAG